MASVVPGVAISFCPADAFSPSTPPCQLHLPNLSLVLVLKLVQPAGESHQETKPAQKQWFVGGLVHRQTRAGVSASSLTARADRHGGEREVEKALPLPLLPSECLSKATGIQSSWAQRGLFHKKSTVFLPSPCILFHMENAVFTESSGRAVLFGLFHFNPAPLVFLDEEQPHQKWIQVMIAKWHLLKLTIQTARRKAGGTTRGSSSQKPLRADNPHDVQTKLSLQQKQCISGKAFQTRSQIHACLPGNKAECEVSTYSSHMSAPTGDAHARVCPGIVLPCCAKLSYPPALCS